MKLKKTKWRGQLLHPKQHSQKCVVIYAGTTKNTLYGVAHYRIRHNTLIHVGLHIQQKSHCRERPITVSDTTLPYLCDYIFKKSHL